jgi:thioredoxin reductase/bacterioferritin-associated ferredoxin
LATGAYDRPLAFPGWTTPGILGAGAALRMIKSQWVLPGKRILLAGLGPLRLALADVLIESGAEVVGIAEASNPYRNWAQLPKFLGNWDRIREAIGYFNTLRKRKVPVWYDHAIVEADGQEQVEKAVIARLDRQGAPVLGTRKEFEVDAVCLGYGLLPSFQLASAFGCQLRFDERLRWFLPVHYHTMETSQPGIFAAGDLAGIAGSKAALVEGQIAGLNAAYQLGAISQKALAERSAPLYSKLKRLDRLADALQEIYAFRPELDKLAREDTLLCRCEEVTLARVKEVIAQGATDLHQVKLAARTGMGYCQGRFCSALVAPLIAEATGQPLSDLLPFTVRPPIQPIPLRILASAAKAKADQ